MIYLKNKGELEVDLITTMGVNVKEGDSIGYFGTGLKYAIAVFLRENIDFKLFIGENEYTFFTESKTIRGKQFDYCYMVGPFDSIQLGFTTELGKNWDIWQAYREIHSNCLDENGSVGTDVQRKEPCSTLFIVEDREEFIGIFLDPEKPLHKSQDVDIYHGESDWIYYNGIRAKQLDKPSRYTYNIKRKCTLTEDRLLCFDYEIGQVLTKAISSMDDFDVINSIITEKECFERTLSFEHFCYTAPSKTFTEAVLANQGNSSSSAQAYIKEHIKSSAPVSEYELIIGKINDLVNDYGLELDIKDSCIVLSGGVLTQLKTA